MKNVVVINETMPGHYGICSFLDKQKTADVLMEFAIRAYQRVAVEIHEKAKIEQGSIINPHTGQTIPGNGKKVKSEPA